MKQVAEASDARDSSDGAMRLEIHRLQRQVERFDAAATSAATSAAEAHTTSASAMLVRNILPKLVQAYSSSCISRS